jgi:hypothetical protein
LTAAVALGEAEAAQNPPDFSLNGVAATPLELLLELGVAVDQVIETYWDLR